jgi:hypothetical protein
VYQAEVFIYFPRYIPDMDPLHATIEEFATEGSMHVEANCPRCRKIRLRPMSWLPPNLDGAHAGEAIK